MTRKHHLQHTVHRGPTCQTGRSGAALRGEHITEAFAEFSGRPADLQCDRCKASKLFAFLQRQATKQDPDLCNGTRGANCVHQDPNNCDRKRDCPAFI
jgi:hypothetical protein